LTGTYGDKFYIILGGSVSVRIPNPNVKEARQQVEDTYKEIAQLRKKHKFIAQEMEMEREIDPETLPHASSFRKAHTVA